MASMTSATTRVGSAWASITTRRSFATAAIRRWWKKMGSKRHRDARELLIMADGGGSNGSRCRLWKVALQDLADRLAMPIHVCHFPPGTSKWNKIEHRMFCHITQNWRGRPLVSHEVIVNLIANTATEHGLRIQAELDHRQYPTGIKVRHCRTPRCEPQGALISRRLELHHLADSKEKIVKLFSRGPLVTGVPRPPKRLLRYDGLRGIVLEPKDQPIPDCPYCIQTGDGDRADWRRHSTAGWEDGYVKRSG